MIKPEDVHIPDPVYASYKGTGHIRTFTHRMVDPFRLEVTDIDPVDCIHSISLLNRFTGHSLRPYSVGEHTLNLYHAVPDHLQKAALIHDWSEAYFNDIASPVKKTMLNYKRHEEEAQRVIFKRMGVDFALTEELHSYDKRICASEMLHLFDPPFKHFLAPLPDVCISPVDMNWKSIRRSLANVAEAEFGLRWVDVFARFGQQYEPPQWDD